MKDLYKNSVEFFREKEVEAEKEESSLILAAYELKTPDNAGSIIRLAGNLGADKVYFIHENFEMRPRKMKRVAHSSLSHVEYHIVSDKEFWEIIGDEIPVIALETTENSKNIYQFKFPKKCVILCGNERFGISNEVLNKCQSSIFIPNPGKTRSMNVSHALTIAAFEWAKQSLPNQMSIK